MLVLRRVLIIVLLFAPAMFASSARTYTFIYGGNRAGHQTTEVVSSSELRIAYEYNDRGRGPKLSTRMLLDDHGVPLKVETTGNDYYKGAVEENFSLQDGKASWHNQAERGEKASSEAFYISLNPVPEEIALLAKVLLHTTGKSIQLLPAGHAAIETGGTTTVSANGRKRNVLLYSLSGLDFLPAFVWLDEDQTYFASVGSWGSTILEGWEATVPELLKIQDAFLNLRLMAVAKQLSHKPSGKLVFEHVNVFDAENTRVLSDHTVVISGTRIEEVGPAQQIKIPQGSQIINGKGKTLLPGLWDMHAHLTDIDGILNLAAGVTSVRDCANDIDKLTVLRQNFDSGTLLGPRITRVGFMDGKGPYAGPTKVLVDTPEEARAAVNRYVDLDYDQIKIYSSIKPELAPVIIQEAHKHGLRVSGHIPAFMTADQAVRTGIDEIHHANFLFLNFLFDIAKDTRTPLRFTAVAEHGAKLDLKSDKVQAFLELLKQRKVVLDPTVNIFESLFTDRRGEPAAALQSAIDRFPLQVQRQAYLGGLPVPEGMDQRYRDSFGSMLRMIKAAYDRGITIVAGTDALAGFALQREFELYVKAGIPAPTVLCMATLGAAKVMKRDHEVGSIGAGKFADVILVKGNPANAIGDLRNVETIVKNGVMYNSEELYQSVGVKPR